MSKENFVPAGCSLVSPHLTVFNVPKAVSFYEKAFGFTAGDIPKSEDGTIKHAELAYRDQVLMFGEEGAFGGTAKAPLSSGVESPLALYLCCRTWMCFLSRQ